MCVFMGIEGEAQADPLFFISIIQSSKFAFDIY